MLVGLGEAGKTRYTQQGLSNSLTMIDLQINNFVDIDFMYPQTPCLCFFKFGKSYSV